MVSGNKHIKMSTSIIDYVFRERAITYLGRTDLAQVLPDDLRADSIGSSPDGDKKKLNEDQDDPEALDFISSHSGSPATGTSGSVRTASVAAQPNLGALAKLKGYEGD